MTANLKYLKYVVKHKIFVFIAGRKLGVPLWRLMIHDWTKFMPAEWSGYRDRFFTGRTGQLDKEQDALAFHLSWTHHWHHNPHHWEYWLRASSANESVTPGAHPMFQSMKPMRMPVTYVFEMVADWMGAGRAITGSWDMTEWFEENKNRMVLHDETRRLAEKLVNVYGKGR